MRKYFLLTIATFFLSAAMVLLVPRLFMWWVALMEWNTPWGFIVTMTIIGPPYYMMWDRPLASEGTY